MYLKNKNVLVIGLGITGLSAVKALDRLQANIYLYDSKSKDDLREFLSEIKNINIKKYLNGKMPDLKEIDLIVKSPGVAPDIPILLRAKAEEKEVISDLELYYRLKTGKNVIAITGTNGKTTTTKLVGEIFEKALYNTFVAGNIGIGVLDKVFEIQENDILVVEASSYQLENIVTFKAHISAIINITPDHIAWHGSFENYIDSKLKILKKQDKNDYSILNYDDKILREVGKKMNSNLIWFSREKKLDEGAYIEDGWIVFKRKSKKNKIIKIEDIQIPGDHNLENILVAVTIATLMGIDIRSIEKSVKEFKGVEHRIEYLGEKGGVSFYNDSKGTNPDSTIKAISAINSPIVLIAGGYDKGSDFNKLIEAFDGKIKDLVLLGQTKEKIRQAAMSRGFDRVHITADMKEAVQLSYKIANKGDNILLSPACASWGMYRNFEERGVDFKNIVEDL